jgi:Flp pilus assembly protein TadD
MAAGQESLMSPPGGGLLRRVGLGLLATAQVLAGRKRAALATYRRILALDPDGATALATTGNLLAETGDADAAIATFRRLVARHPKDAEGWFNLGFLLEKRDEIEEAEICFRTAVAIRPSLDRAWYGLGLVLIRGDRLEEAIAPLKRTTEIQPFSPYGWYQLGMTYHHLGRELEARRIHEALRKFEPRYAATLWRDLQKTPPRRAERETGRS